MKQIVIVKDSSTKVRVYKDYLDITNIYESRVIGLNNIKELYINQLIQIVPSEFLKLSCRFPIYFINQRGHILGYIKKEENAQV